MRYSSLFLSFVLALQLVFSACTTVPVTRPGQASAPADLSNNLDADRLSRRIHELTNVQRRRNGLPALTWNASLATIARRHSQDMIRRDYFSHLNKSGQDPTARAAEAGFTCRIKRGDRIYTGVAENIADSWTYSRWTTIRRSDGRTTKQYEWKSLDELAGETVNGWMNSPGHRANILARVPSSEGIGVAISDDGRVTITQNFC